MNKWTLTRPVRGLAYASGFMGSELRKLSVRLRYPGVKFIGHVHLERGTRIAAIRTGQVTISGCHVSQNTQILAGDGGMIRLEADFVGPNSMIVAQSRVVIGEGSKIAEMVVIRDANHDHAAPLRAMQFNSAPVMIGKDVWLGARATVLAGVELGDHVTVGAGSVVTKSFGPRTVIVGVPAK